jgi:P-type Cu+ transporter
MRSIRQNLFFALAYNAVGMPVAAGVLCPSDAGGRGDEPVVGLGNRQRVAAAVGDPQRMRPPLSA